MMAWAVATVGAPSKKIKKTKKAKSQNIQKNEKKPVSVAPSPAPATPVSTPSSWQLKGVFGLSRWSGLGFWSGIGLGFIPRARTQLRLGAEANILLVSGGSLSSILFLADWMPGGESFYNKGASLGLIAGPGFSMGGITGKPTVLVVFLQGAWNEKMREGVQIELVLRGGRIGDEWALQPGINFFFQFS